MVSQIVIDVDGNMHDIYFYTPEPVPVSAIGNIGYSGTSKLFCHICIFGGRNASECGNMVEGEIWDYNNSEELFRGTGNT